MACGFIVLFLFLVFLSVFRFGRRCGLLLLFQRGDTIPQPLLFGVVVAAVDAVQRSHVAAAIHGCRILLRGGFRFLVFFHNRGVLSVRSAGAVFLLL